jgi:hypothetical protein
MQQQFTDNDIQDYLEGIFYGDIRSLEEYLLNTEEGKKRLDYFKAMFRALESGPVPLLNISLDDAVMAALDERDKKKSFNWNKPLWLLTAACVVGVMVFGFIFLDELSFFAKAANSVIVPLIIVAAILLSLAFHGIDWYRQMQRYNRWLT